MKAINTKLIITSFRSKSDSSLGLTASTPELSAKEKVAFMELQNHELDATFNPLDINIEEVEVVQKDMDVRSISQRKRAVLYVYHKLLKEKGKSNKTFSQFYEDIEEKNIENVKGKIRELEDK